MIAMAEPRTSISLSEVFHALVHWLRDPAVLVYVSAGAETAALQAQVVDLTAALEKCEKGSSPAAKPLYVGMSGQSLPGGSSPGILL